MIFVAGLMLAGLMVIGLILMLAFRAWSRDENTMEDWIRSPETHTVVYLVPEGVDPALLMAALAHAGFTARTDTSGGEEHLLVVCMEDEREKVRDLIERTERKSAAETGFAAPPVAFDDEPPRAAPAV